MTTQYQVPLHLCQWCYKNTGRFIVDCMCLACEPCLKAKTTWVDQNGRCFNCEKNTTRRFIDLKNNPQQGGFYFQNVSNSALNFLKIQDFQQEVAKKYCKHLQLKVKKLESVIKQFVHQFPKYGSYFENAFRQIQQKQNKNFRSKSAEMQMVQNPVNKGTMHQNNTERNLPNLPMKHQQMQRANYENLKYPINSLPDQRNINYPQQYQKKEKNNYAGSKASLSSMKSNLSGKMMFQNQNPQVKKQSYQNGLNYDSVPKSNIRKDPSKMMINPSKIQSQQNQGFGQTNANQVYVMGGSKNVSDPRRQQQPIKLNNAVNLQTAIRSIRSERSQDERDYQNYPQNQNHIQMNNHQLNPDRKQFKFQQDSNHQNNGVNLQGQNLHFFGRRSK